MALDNIQYGSRIVNGQLVPVLEWQALASGNAVGPVFGGGPAYPATIPPNASGGPMRSSQAAQAASSNPFSFRSSPVPLLLIMLIVGVLGLRYVHWRT